MKQDTKTTTKAAKPNLFASAKKVETKKESKSKLPSLPVSAALRQQLTAYVEAKMQCKNWEAKKGIAEGEIKAEAATLYLEEYKKQGRNIGSFKLGDVTVSVQDRYTKMTKDVAAIVAKNFPDVVETKTEYLFNQEILEKYIEEINEALQNADIPEDDLAQLIQADETTIVKKGTIDTLATYGDKMDDLFQAISPIISMR